MKDAVCFLACALVIVAMATPLWWPTFRVLIGNLSCEKELRRSQAALEMYSALNHTKRSELAYSAERVLSRRATIVQGKWNSLDLQCLEITTDQLERCLIHNHEEKRFQVEAS